MKNKQLKTVYIKGRVLPLILLILSLLFVATFFGTFISGPNGFSVTAWDAISGAFNYPIIEKLGIETDSLYYNTFVAPSDILTRQWTGISDLLEFMSRYVMILAFLVSIFNVICNVFMFIKSIIKGKTTTKMHTNSGSLIVNCVLGAGAIPAFQPNAPLPFIKGLLDLATFNLHYNMGLFFALALGLGIILFFLPYIWKFILKITGKNDKLETVIIDKQIK